MRKKKDKKQPKKLAKRSLRIKTGIKAGPGGTWPPSGG